MPLGTRIVGSVRADLDVDDIYYIGRLIVRPDYLRRGIGTRFMYQIEAIFRLAQRFHLVTGSRSLDNIRLFKNLDELVKKSDTPLLRPRTIQRDKLQPGSRGFVTI